MLFNRWRRSIGRPQSTASRATGRPKPCRPRLEALEDRTLPSTLTVKNFLDDGSADSLRGRIQAAASKDTIVFDPSLPAGTIALNTVGPGRLVLNKDLTINGPTAVAVTINAENLLSSAFTVNANVNATISHLTITKGRGTLGGGIHNEGNLTLTDCSVTQNSSTRPTGGTVDAKGGGIYNTGTLTLKNTNITQNMANAPGTNGSAYGGGIYNAGTLNLDGDLVDNNSAKNFGGGIYSASFSTLTIANSTVSNNKVGGTNVVGQGAGIFNSSTLTVTNSTITGNQINGTGFGNRGGGLYNQSNTTVMLTNTTISGNSAKGGDATQGGGIYTLPGPLTLINCTVAGNSVSGTSGIAGGGIYTSFGGQAATLRNTIVAGNTAPLRPDINDSGVTATNSLIGDGTSSGLVNGTNGNQVGTAANPIDPKLGALQDNGGPTKTRALLAGSPAIDKGSSTGITLDTDQRGFKRTVNNTIDIGAYEFQPPGTTTKLDPLQAVKTGKPVTFTASVTADAPGSNDLNGTVTFFDGTTQLGNPVDLANGKAAFTTSTLAIGAHAITARYNGFTKGDFQFAQSASSAQTQNVNRSSVTFFAVTGAGRVEVRKVSDGSLVANFRPYGSDTTGISAAFGDVYGDGRMDLVVGGINGPHDVKIYDGNALDKGTFDNNNPDASLLFKFTPYDPVFNVGEYVTAADVNSDGFADIVTGASIGNPNVKVFNGADIANKTFNPTGSSLLRSFFPYQRNFNVGVSVSAYDINGDGFADIVTGALPGNPHVRIFDGKAVAKGPFTFDEVSNPTANQLASPGFFPYAINFNIGAYVAVADIYGDGGDLITGTTGGNPEVRVYKNADIRNPNFNPQSPDNRPANRFYANAANQNVGVTVGAGKFEGEDKPADILVGVLHGPPNGSFSWMVVNGKTDRADTTIPSPVNNLTGSFSDSGGNIYVGM